MNYRVATRFCTWTFPLLNPASSRCIVWQPLRLRRTRPPTRGSNTPQPYGRNCPCNSTCTCNPSVKRPFASSYSSKQKKDGECGAKREHLLLKTRLSTARCGHHKDGWPLPARLCARSQISPQSNYVRKSFEWDCKPKSIIGGSWHKYHFCRDKHFVATNTLCLPRQNFCRHKNYVCRAKKQKWHLRQLPPMIVVRHSDWVLLYKPVLLASPLTVLVKSKGDD